MKDSDVEVLGVKEQIYRKQRSSDHCPVREVKPHPHLQAGLRCNVRSEVGF